MDRILCYDRLRVDTESTRADTEMSASSPRNSPPTSFSIPHMVNVQKLEAVHVADNSSNSETEAFDLTEWNSAFEARSMVASVGGAGHPHFCMTPCKYFRRKGGCRHGAKCPSCHFCQWSRDPKRKSACRSAIPHEAPSPDTGSSSRVSVGSIGHPHYCAQACKYNSKKAGCKDGSACARCHLCRWSRCCARSEKSSGGLSKELDKSAMTSKETQTELVSAPDILPTLLKQCTSSPPAPFIGAQTVAIEVPRDAKSPMYITLLESPS